MLQNKIYQPPTPKTRTSSGVSSTKKLLKVVEHMKTTRDFETQANSDFQELTTPRTQHRKQISHQTPIKKNSKYPLIIQHCQLAYSNAFHKQDIEKAIDALIEVMIIQAYRDNIQGIFQTYILIAETYVKFSHYGSAIQVWTQMLHLCDVCNDVDIIRKNYRLKILLKLAYLAHTLRLYDVASKILKKLLQYAWQLEDRYIEMLCFDKLGQTEYLMANLEKAQFYHQRSIWGRQEPITSNHFIIATQNVRTYMKKLPKDIIHIDNNMISKATYLPFTFSVGNNKYVGVEIENQYIKNNPNITIVKQQHRFASQLSPELCYLKLFATPLFEFEISTPRQAKQDQYSNDLNRISPQELFMNTLQHSTNREEILYYNKMKSNVNILGGFIPPNSYKSKKKESLNFDKKLLKQPLQKMVTDRITSIPEQTEVIYERYRAAKMNHSRVPLRDKVRISHLSPNRDLQIYGECMQAQADPDLLFISNVLF